MKKLVGCTRALIGGLLAEDRGGHPRGDFVRTSDEIAEMGCPFHVLPAFVVPLLGVDMHKYLVLEEGELLGDLLCRVGEEALL